MFIRDAGDGFGTLQKTVDRKNFEFLANRDVKTFEDLQKFIKKTNITPKEAAAAIARHAVQGSNWTKYQIIRSKSERSMIKALHGMEKKLTTKGLYGDPWLEDFADITGYQIPKSMKTFYNEMTEFKKVFGANRKHDGTFTRERQLKEAARKLLKRK